MRVFSRVFLNVARLRVMLATIVKIFVLEKMAALKTDVKEENEEENDIENDDVEEINITGSDANKKKKKRKKKKKTENGKLKFWFSNTLFPKLLPFSLENSHLLINSCSFLLSRSKLFTFSLI